MFILRMGIFSVSKAVCTINIVFHIILLFLLKKMWKDYRVSLRTLEFRMCQKVLYNNTCSYITGYVIISPLFFLQLYNILIVKIAIHASKLYCQFWNFVVNTRYLFLSIRLGSDNQQLYTT